MNDALDANGTLMLVEPIAVADVENNVNPVSRVYYAGAVGICTPAAQARDGDYALGNRVSDDRWQELLAEAGFSRFRRAAERPSNRIFEVRR